MYQFSPDFDIQHFLTHVWQKKPLLIRQGLVEFVDPLSPDDLASIAMEDDAESRVVSNNNDTWQVEHGPFHDYHAFGENCWSLLVQGVEQWHDQGAELLRMFDFIPNWRIDDLMVSFSTPKGGVGPHVDEYDVFIIQGQGTRHWRVGLPQGNQSVIAAEDLRQVDAFDACIDVEMQPGDILYIPPHHPHEGYAITPALNYSVGARAPSQIDMLSACADHFIDHELGNARYADKAMAARNHSGQITADEVQALQSLMLNGLNNPLDFMHWFGRYNTEAKSPLALHPEPISEDEIQQLPPTAMLYPCQGYRAVYFNHEDALLFFVCGDMFQLNINQIELVEKLCENCAISVEKVLHGPNLLENTKILSRLVSKGYWLIEY